MNGISEFFANNFSSCVWLAVIIVAMIPTLESKIAIPLGMNGAIWGIKALSPFVSFALATFGTILPCYFVLIFARKLKKHTSLVLHSKFFQKYAIKGAQVSNKKNHLKYLALSAFVAIPVPLTGVWSGSLIAGFSNLNIHMAFMAITCGAVVSSALTTLLCQVFNNSLSYILIFTLAIIIIVMFVDLLSQYVTKRKAK